MSTPRLPHGRSFAFVDDVEIDRAAESACARKFLDPSLSIFADHFPGEPIFPGVLLVECGAQAAGCLWSELLGRATPRAILLAQIVAFKFVRTVLPGQTLFILVKRERTYGRLAEFSVAIRESDELVAAGRIVLSSAERSCG
ncbi:3-hydroxyacyl-[acyl-carrier-protein] dehydratase [Methylacidimicrobium cyclopophantes]|uniref:3-hydroxyacyl-[acyl-carrier-protein] dehydratase n=1 Tax=Methylacidimicrobium cyclopophantes TaxID=1041766 RepID=A0A5E6MDA3_9BACT|nr:hypothetical protein [Methylacidimicrobium cyclopophantes]VVM07430.1 3-hydroxyacyl-[acyl-carrier-protein] dehydratase [Methylacidimicrobium cyclopophantes]